VGGGLYGCGEVSGDAGEGGEEEVAEGVAFEGAAGEAVLEETREEVLVFGEGDETGADIAGRREVKVFAEAAGGAAVVGDGDDGGELADEAGGLGAAGFDGGRGAGGCCDEAFEAAKEGGEACTAADGDDAELTGMKRV
jgi:hypothetical protein